MSDPVTRLNTALEGRYEIERELGQGGMATVYLARDQRHNRNVALKVLKPELAAVVGGERFLAEIETTAKLQHPHILPLFDSGEADGFLFYVMPSVEGESLRERLHREHQFPVDEAVGIAMNVAEALDYAHRHGVIHRDIKPANILLQDGKPIVSDFGIALAVGAAGGGRLTETGLSLGTPHYMSPEQATGDRSVGSATDTYALACVLYEMLVGEPPFTGSTPQAVLGKIVTGDAPSAMAERKSVPPNVDAAIAKALERLPADRFASAHDLAAALGNPSFRHRQVVAWARGGVSRAWKSAALGLGVTAGVFATGWALERGRPGARTPVIRYEETFSEGQEMAGTFEGEMALSPDGDRLVYRGPGSQLWVRDRDRLTSVPVPGTAGGVEPSFSPDGEYVAFRTEESELKVVSFADEPARTLVPGDLFPAGVAWGSDGHVYYVTQTDLGILRIPADGGGGPEFVTSPEAGEVVHRGPEPLPDGRGLLFQIEGGTETRVGVLDFETGARRVLDAGRSPRYVPSGHVIYVSDDGALMAAPFDLDRMDASGPAIPVETGVVPERGSFVISPSGRLAYLANTSPTGRQVVWVERDGTETPVDPSRIGPDLEPVRVSPEGTRWALGAEEQVWIMHLDTGELDQLTEGQFVSYISPDGDLLRKRADGSAEGELLWDDERPIRQGIVVDDLYVITLGGATDQDLYAVRRSDGSRRPIAALDGVPERAPALSPDQRFVAYVSNESGTDEVYVRSLADPDGRTWQISQEGGIQPVWGNRRTELFYVNAANQLVSVPVTTEPAFAILGPPELLFSTARYLDPPNGVHYDVGPDDQRFAMIRRRASAVPDRLIVVENFLEELNRLVPVN
jgi:hypothetical protein